MQAMFNTILKRKTYTDLSMPLVRYLSTDSDADTSVTRSPTGNAHHEAIDNWENLQIATKACIDYFTLLDMDKILRKGYNGEIEALRQRFTATVQKIQEDSIPSNKTEREIIESENQIILSQSQIIDECIAVITKYDPDGQDIVSTAVNALILTRNKLVKERRDLSELWMEEIDHEEKLQGIQNTGEQAKEGESSILQQAFKFGNPFKRKRDVSDDGQPESSKRQETDGRENLPGGSQNPIVIDEGKTGNNSSPEGSKRNPIMDVNFILNDKGKGKADSPKQTPGEYIDSLPRDYNPFDDIGDD